MVRSVQEWQGKNDDTPVPPRVRLRVFERWKGVCHVSGRRIRPGDAWAVDHVVPVIQGGENRENNLAPILLDPHKAKTKAEVAEKSRVAKRRKSHLGIKKPSRFPGSKSSPWKKKLDGSVVRRD
jgi:5-methylcytosine-specific restriction enzyme A